MVYVLNKNGKPLMPCKEAKARHLLEQGKAKVVKIMPFTIQLMFECENQTQPVSLGIDAGSKHIGISATTEKKVLYEADIELRNDIVDLLSSRREARRSRRNRKTRYRQARFNNRKRKNEWLAPSVMQKIQTHLNVVANVHKILPISKTNIEVASFDIQKIKNPEISGIEYQQGEQLGFWNVREYVLARDGFICQCCKGKSKDKVLNVHHIESRKTGGNSPGNLVTLCKTCHQNFHKGIIQLPKTIRRTNSFRDAAFMGIMRWACYNKLKEQYPNVSLTYGYITKKSRIENNLPKEHYIDARCISGNPLAESDGSLFLYKKVRRHNRKLFKDKILKGGKVKANQCPYTVFGFHRFDIVKWEKKIYFVNSLRTRGTCVIKDLQDKNFQKEVSYKKLRLVQNRNGYVIKLIKTD